MKIAKKLLAAVVAVMLVCSLTVIAFAENNGSVVLKASEIVDGKFTVQAIAKNYSGLDKADWVITFDDTILDCTKVGNGLDDVLQIGSDPITMAVIQNKLIVAANPDAEEGVLVGFAFESTLGTDDEVVLFTMYFDVIDADAIKDTITLSGHDNAQVTVQINDEPETQPSDPETQPSDPETQPSDPETQPSDPETQPSDPETQPSDPETDPETQPSAPIVPPCDDDDNEGDDADTGDSAVLAAAAGVVLLAGAAFVVSKKRK